MPTGVYVRTEEMNENNRLGHLGIKHTPEAIERCRQSNLGKKKSPEHIEKISKANLGKKRTPEQIEANRQRSIKYLSNIETKEKMRKSAIKRIEKNNGIARPNFNPSGCEYFELFDAQYNTSGKYATNGGEHYISELGYYPDYINFDLKLIIEWDEKHHYYGGKLKHKDVIRQQEIQKHFPNFEFFRIKET